MRHEAGAGMKLGLRQVEDPRDAAGLQEHGQRRIALEHVSRPGVQRRACEERAEIKD